MNSQWVTASRPRTPTLLEDPDEAHRGSGSWDNDHVRLTAQNLNNAFERFVFIYTELFLKSVWPLKRTFYYKYDRNEFCLVFSV
jgi:hypothetical protein